MTAITTAGEKVGTTTWRLVDLLDDGDNALARVQRIEAAGEFDTFEAALEAAKRFMIRPVPEGYRGRIIRVDAGVYEGRTYEDDQFGQVLTAEWESDSDREVYLHMDEGLMWAENTYGEEVRI